MEGVGAAAGGAATRTSSVPIRSPVDASAAAGRIAGRGTACGGTSAVGDPGRARGSAGVLIGTAALYGGAALACGAAERLPAASPLLLSWSCRRPGVAVATGTA